MVELEEDRFVVGFSKYIRIEKKLGMIDTLKVKQSRQETLFSCMIVSLHGSQGSFICIG